MDLPVFGCRNSLKEGVVAGVYFRFLELSPTCLNNYSVSVVQYVRYAPVNPDLAWLTACDNRPGITWVGLQLSPPSPHLD